MAQAGEFGLTPETIKVQVIELKMPRVLWSNPKAQSAVQLKATIAEEIKAVRQLRAGEVKTKLKIKPMRPP